MQKKVMALAVAGALAAPAALAQVQIGGGIHLQYYNNDSGRTGFEKVDYLTTSEPEIYIRGEEKLGGGLSTWFQCTSSFDVLGTAAGARPAFSGAPAAGNASSTVAASASQWCGRNSAIGFRGDFGNVFFGTWDTPHKLVSNLARGWWGGTNTLQGGTLQILANGSDSNLGNQGSSFFRRQSRSINYHSPDWGGFNLNVATSSANEGTSITTASGIDKPRLMSLAGQYRTGPFFAGVGYEKHENYSAVNASDQSMNAAVGFTFAGVARVSALYMSVEYKPDAGTKLEADGFALYLDWTISGPHKLYAQWASRGDAKSAGTTLSATGTDVMGLAYGYSFSKRTQVYVAYNEMKNDANAAFSMGTTNSTTGGKQKVIGFGLRHSF
jgi:predicted porin